PAPAHLRLRLLLAVPPLGPLSAHLELQPLSLRGDPLRVSVPGRAPRPGMGRPVGRPGTRLRRRGRGPLRPLPSLSHRPARAREPLVVPFPPRSGTLDLVPHLGLGPVYSDERRE